MYFDNVNKEMLKIFKSSAQATLGAMSMLEDQTERMANFLMENSVALQKEGHRCVEQWIDSTKTNQAELRTAYNNWVESVTGLMVNGSGLQVLIPQNEKKKTKK